MSVYLLSEHFACLPDASYGWYTFLLHLIALGLALLYTHNFYNFYNRDCAGVEVVTDKAVSKLVSINTVSTQSRATRFRKWSATKWSRSCIMLHCITNWRNKSCSSQACLLHLKPSAAKPARCGAIQVPSVVQRSFKWTFVHHLWLLLPLHAELEQRCCTAPFLMKYVGPGFFFTFTL